MGGGVPSKHQVHCIEEFIAQKGKPADAADVTALDDARAEIQKLRALTQELDIRDFDDYLRSKKYKNASGGLEDSHSRSRPVVEVAIVAARSEVTEGACHEHTPTQTRTKTQSAKIQIAKPIPAADALISSQSIMEVNRIAQSVKVKLDHRFISLDEAFRKLDLKNSGFISKQEFLDACWYWGVQLEESDFSMITSKTLNGAGAEAGCIGYTSFIELMSRITRAEYTAGDLNHEQQDETQIQSDHSSRIIDNMLRSRVLDSGHTMKQCFREFDKDASGCIEREEMKMVLDSLNVKYSNEDVDALFHDFDVNGDGKFQYSEFVRLIQGRSK